MKLTYLGTAASEGWPAIFCQCPLCAEAARSGGRDLRYRSCALLDSDTLLDASPDLFAAKIRFSIDLGRVRHVFFTHSHADHFALEQLLWYAPHFARIDDHEPLRLYGSAQTHDYFLRAMALYASPFIRGWIEFTPLPFYQVTRVGDMDVTIFPAEHRAPGAGVYRVARGGKTLIYLHDTGGLDERTLEILSCGRADLVSLDATGGIGRAAEGSGHMSLEKASELCRLLIARGAADGHTRFVASHICIHGCGENGTLCRHETLEERARALGLVMAYDGMTVEV